MKGPSSDPVEYLRAQIREQDRKIDDLYRRVGDRPTKVEPPPATGGGGAEAFAVLVDSGATVTAGDYTRVALKVVSSPSVAEYRTAGITIDTANDRVMVPSGLWTYHANVAIVYQGLDPTEGHVRINGPYQDAAGYQEYTAFTPDDEDECTIQLTEDLRYSINDSIYVEVFNFTDATLTIGYGRIHGHKIGEASEAVGS